MKGKSRWTQAYFKWLDSLVFENALYKETLQEYLALYYTLDEKIAVYDARIEELAHQKRYEENVRKLCCFKGVSTHTALPLLVEVGDFHRFRTAQHFSAYLGLVPGESSSGEKVIHTNITKDTAAVWTICQVLKSCCVTSPEQTRYISRLQLYGSAERNRWGGGHGAATV